MGKTSTQSKQKWLAKNYKPISVKLPIPLMERWEAKLKEDGIAKAAFVRSRILEYLGESETETSEEE